MTQNTKPPAIVPTLPSVITYRPTEEQRQAKAFYWLEFKKNPMCDPKDITPAAVEQVLEVSIANWLKDKEFWPWFKEPDSTKKYLETAAEKAAEMAIMLMDPSVPLNDNARVSLIKTILEFSGRSPPNRKEIKWHDRDIADLSEEQLDALIAKLSNKRPQSKP